MLHRKQNLWCIFLIVLSPKRCNVMSDRCKYMTLFFPADEK